MIQSATVLFTTLFLAMSTQLWADSVGALEMTAGQAAAGYVGSPMTTSRDPGLEVERDKLSEEAIILAEAAARPEESAKPGDKKREAIKPVDKISDLKLQILKLQNKGKLGFRKVVACKRIEGFGSYAPLESGADLHSMALYIEPSNVSTLISEGRYIVDCTVDVLALDANGKVVWGKKNVSRFHRISHSPILDVYLRVGFKLKRLKKSLAFRIILQDNIKNQSKSVTLKLNAKKKGNVLDGV